MSFFTRPFFCLPIKDKNSIYHTLTVFSFFIIKAICSVLPINIANYDIVYEMCDTKLFKRCYCIKH